MDKPYVVYGRKGTGSVPVEATLLLLGEPYEVIEPASPEKAEAGGFTPETMGLVNPMQQIPALRLPNGEVMTESAAILIYLADSHPSSRLSPAPGDPRRPAFLRWMCFVSAQIYGLIWVTDDRTRLAVDQSHEGVIVSRVRERMAHCWGMMEAQITPGRYLLGDDLTALDIYVAVVSAWGPRRQRFYEMAPKMGEVIRRVDQDPRLKTFWAERFN
jgi:GST-like protein